MDNATVRKATIEDLSQIQELCNTLSEQSHSIDNDLNVKWAHGEEGKKYYEERIDGSKGTCFIAEKDGKIAGFASGTIHNVDEWRLIKRVELDNIFIVETHRGAGLGKLLLDAFKQWAKEIDAQRVTLTAYTTNTKAISLYEREGFLPYETTLEYKLK